MKETVQKSLNSDMSVETNTEYVETMRNLLKMNYPDVVFEDSTLKVGSKIVLKNGTKMVISAHFEDHIELEFENTSPLPVGYKLHDGQGRELVVTKSDGDDIEVEYC